MPGKELADPILSEKKLEIKGKKIRERIQTRGRKSEGKEKRDL